jgi:hypothetical protein
LLSVFDLLSLGAPLGGWYLCEYLPGFVRLRSDGSDLIVAAAFVAASRDLPLLFALSDVSYLETPAKEVCN